jgi:hypothetical protein
VVVSVIDCHCRQRHYVCLSHCLAPRWMVLSHVCQWCVPTIMCRCTIDRDTTHTGRTQCSAGRTRTLPHTSRTNGSCTSICQDFMQKQLQLFSCAVVYTKSVTFSVRIRAEKVTLLMRTTAHHHFIQSVRISCKKCNYKYVNSITHSP